MVISVLGLTLGGGALIWRSAVWFPGVDASLLWFALFIFPLSLLHSYLHAIVQGV